MLLTDPLEPQPSFGWAVRFGRGMAQRSLRELAAETGISAGQLSRYANEKADRPSFDTVVRLAPALGIHPACLHVLAGHLTDEDARQALRSLIEVAADEIEREYDAVYVDRLRSDVESATADAELRQCAVELVTLPIHSIDFPNLPGLSEMRTPDVDLLEELVAAWPQLTPERRWRLVELTRDLRRCSIQERRVRSDEMDKR